MKNLIVVAIIAITTFSCKNPGKIKVQNQVSNTEISNISWGDILITNALLPGQTSIEVSVTNRDLKLPAEHPISFVIQKNGRIVYLVTEEVFRLDTKDNVLIVIEDETKIQEY